MRKDLNTFVREYPSSLDAETCNMIIRRFEEDTVNQEHISLIGHRSFTEINCSSTTQWHDIHEIIVNKTIDVLPKYCKDIELDPRQLPEQYGFEQIRIKRYVPNMNDEFRLHVDVGDHSSARRFLVCLWYLNTVAAGGETVFPWFMSDGSARVVKPIQGQLLIFPPMWMYPHAGNKPFSNTKYIIGTYLHYL